MSTPTILKTLPWGGQVFMEIPLHKNSANKFYARHGKNVEGRDYIEFTKFGPMPNAEGEWYMQKLRLFDPKQWLQIKHSVEGELADSIGWNLDDAEKQFNTENIPAKKEPVAAKTN